MKRIFIKIHNQEYDVNQIMLRLDEIIRGITTKSSKESFERNHVEKDCSSVNLETRIVRD